LHASFLAFPYTYVGSFGICDEDEEDDEQVVCGERRNRNSNVNDDVVSKHEAESIKRELRILPKLSIAYLYLPVSSFSLVMKNTAHKTKCIAQRFDNS
jgi:hypothetical protein